MKSNKRILAKVAKSASCFQALGNPYRMAIVILIKKEPATPSFLAQKLGIKEPLIVHHIAMLTKTGWITRTRSGFHVSYGLKKTMRSQLQKLLSELS
jgi:DNA-binding transcriptional ArsR family regulator